MPYLIELVVGRRHLKLLLFLSLPETKKEKSFFSFIVLGSEKTYTFRVPLNKLPRHTTLVRGILNFLFSSDATRINS